MRIGFAGLGRMGRRMAVNLVAAGHDVVLWNRTSETAAALAQETGARHAATLAELASGAEVIVSVLADDAAARGVYLGPTGLIAAGDAPLMVEMGTMSPDLIAELGIAATSAGKIFVDAPVSGATEVAERGDLLIMAGADEALAPRLSPIFDALGRKTIWLRRPGAGAVMKLAVNMLIHGMNQTLAEALALADGAGIAPDLAFTVIENSAAAAPMFGYRRPLYLAEGDHAVTFTVALARKDMEVTAALASELGISIPQSQVTLAKLREAEEAGFASRDMAAMVAFMKETTK